MSVYEDLSRLLDGELDPTAEAELRARIAAEPELRAAWERLQRLPFERLLRADPPAGLDARLAPRRWRGALPWLVAAAALVAAVVPRDGELAVQDGEALVIDVAGRTEVVLQPEGGDPMTRKTWLAGAGAALTVLVAEGTATVRAGEPLAPAPPVPSPVPAASPAPGLDLENAVLRKMVEDLDAELHGVPVPWPAGLPDALQPAAFERNLRAAVAACTPEVEIVSIDCREPPCLAALRGPGSPYGEGRTWYDALVNECPQWTDPYTNGVAWASGEVECGDGRTDRFNVLGWSTSLAPEAFPDSEQENRSKRFTTRVDEIRGAWPCD